MDIGALAGGAVALVVGLLSWGQSRATNRRADFTTIAAELRKDVEAERTQRKLLTSYVVDLWRWAARVGPDTPAGPVPEPPAELDLTPWRT
ncbi:hypothetical protein ACGFZR_24875 [Streptomyces sp. NPDC048241]|uniref:hypothetical protein n=1 Tax=Streptomyces sp. NPDC048241 TaxID=3365521 RepID=UPI00372049FB